MKLLPLCFVGSEPAKLREHLLTVAAQTRNQGVKGLGPGYGPNGLARRAR